MTPKMSDCKPFNTSSKPIAGKVLSQFNGNETRGRTLSTNLSRPLSPAFQGTLTMLSDKFCAQDTFENSLSDYDKLLRTERPNNTLLWKYTVHREKPCGIGEIGKTFADFFTDLEHLLPKDKEVLNYMRSLAKSLTKDSNAGENEACCNKKKAKRWFRFTETKMIKPSLLKLHDNAGSMPNIHTKQTSDSVTEKLSGKNITVRHKHVASLDMKKVNSPKVPKLDLGRARVASQGYMEEFLEKMDEFSDSWRHDAEIMKTVSKGK